MIKKCLIIFILLLTCSCASFNETQTREKIDELLFQSKDSVNYIQNNHTDYINYYLPSDMTEIEYGKEYVVFSFYNSRIVMNINVNSLINNEFYNRSTVKDEGFFKNDKLFYANSGKYLNVDNKELSYFINIYDYDSYFLINFMSEEINIYAYSLPEELYQTVRHILVIVKGTTIDHQIVIDNYSESGTVEYQRQQVDLFQYVIPKEGYLEDLVKENSEEN